MPWRCGESRWNNLEALRFQQKGTQAWGGGAALASAGGCWLAQSDLPWSRLLEMEWFCKVYWDDLCEGPRAHLNDSKQHFVAFEIRVASSLRKHLGS